SPTERWPGPRPSRRCRSLTRRPGRGRSRYGLRVSGAAPASGPASPTSPSRGGSCQADLRQGYLLAGRQRVPVETVDQALEQAMPVDGRPQMDEYRTESDRGAVHEHKLPWRPNAPHAAQLAEHVLRHVAPESFRDALCEPARPIIHQWTVKE